MAVGRAGVALRKESVDRNIAGTASAKGHSESLSARRAWIEIVFIFAGKAPYMVALRKESVDRNCLIGKNRPSVGSRSPQGERG